MSRLRSFAALVIAVSLTLLLGGSTVYAEGDHDGAQKQGERGIHSMHGNHCGHHEWQMFKGLNLTSAQKEHMKNIMKRHHNEYIENKIAVLQARQTLMTVTTSQTFDESAVRKAYGAMSAAQEKMTVIHAKVFSEIMPILTPDQQAVVQGRLAKSKLRMQKAVTKLQEKRELPAK